MEALCRIFVILIIWSISKGDYSYWSPDGVKDLWCPDTDKCFTNIKQIASNNCCACRAIPQWELPKSNLTYQPLAIEIFDPQEKRSKVSNISAYVRNSTVFSFTYIYGQFRHLPENTCEFDIVFIDVSHNQFTEIGNISCFINLDTLIMKNNRITFVSNKTFIGMDKLRKVDLSHNLITDMNLNVLSGNGVLYFDFGSNKLRQVDATNFVAMNKIMCGVKYANNRHPLNITNFQGFQLGENTSIMCNDVDVSGCETSSLLFIPISQNIDSSEFGKYIPCGEHLYTGSSIACDCNVAELSHQSFVDVKRFIKKEEPLLFCQTPESLHNKPVVDVFDSEEMRDLMICTIKDYCHSKPDCQCECTSQPSRNRLLVDCSNQLCTDFPDIIPSSKHDVTLIMKNNSIRDIKSKPYFSRVKIFDLSENPVQNIHNNIDMLVKASDTKIYNHSLQTLPKTIKHLDPDVFRLKQNGIPCTCENIWIGEWRNFKKASREYPLYCSNYDNILIEDKVLRCKDSNAYLYWSAGIVLLLFITLLILLFIFQHFQFDFIILKRRLSGPKPHKKWEYDVYISANEEDNDVRYFILRFLEPLLSKKKYSNVRSIQRCSTRVLP